MRRRLAAAFLLVALAGCGGADSRSSPTVTVSLPPTSPPATTPTVRAPTAPGQPDGTGPAESAAADPRTNALERSAARTVRRYFEALDARDGAAVCELLVRGAVDLVDFPADRGSCGASLNASIGYRDPRGLPVWAATKITGLRVEVDGASAKVVADVVTRFTDRDQPSIEDDIVYLTRSGGAWLVAKPSATLYRAVGIADVPLAVLSPPD